MNLVREPDTGNPSVRFDERRLETEPRRGVRHRHCESRRQQLPPFAYRHRASRRLYNFPLNDSSVPFCQGLPGSMNAVSISTVCNQPSSAVAMNSGPLSDRR